MANGADWSLPTNPRFMGVPEAIQAGDAKKAIRQIGRIDWESLPRHNSQMQSLGVSLSALLLAREGASPKSKTGVNRGQAKEILAAFLEQPNFWAYLRACALQNKGMQNPRFWELQVRALREADGSFLPSAREAILASATALLPLSTGALTAVRFAKHLPDMRGWLNAAGQKQAIEAWAPNQMEPHATMHANPVALWEATLAVLVDLGLIDPAHCQERAENLLKMPDLAGPQRAAAFKAAIARARVENLPEPVWAKWVERAQGKIAISPSPEIWSVAIQEAVSRRERVDLASTAALASPNAPAADSGAPAARAAKRI